jgi:CHASE2 domain
VAKAHKKAPPEPPPNHSVKDLFRRLTWKFWITFILACTLVEGAEFAFERLIESKNHEASGALFALTGLYQKLVTAVRVPEVRRTVIVEIDPEQDFPTVSNKNVCPEREFLSHLLARIDTGSTPAVIVIDKFFGKNTCLDKNDPGTPDLLKTVDAIRRKGHNLVVGRLTQPLPEAQQSPGAPQSFLADSLEFPPTTLPHQEGIVNIAWDSRRLPLLWKVYADITRGDRIVRDTLAMSTALAFDSDLLAKDPRLSGLLEGGEQPFIGFLGAQQWEDAHAHFYASEILCGHPDRSEDWRQCEQDAGAVPAALNHQIVIIGEHDSADQHDSVVGSVQGSYLQANYIEALLDSQFLSPGGPWADYGLGFLFLLALELILILFHDRITLAIVSIAALALVSYGILLLIVLLLKVYVDPVPVGATGCVIKILHLAYGKIMSTGHSLEGGAE